MFKKTFYTFLALGALIIIGSVTSGFINTTTTTKTSSETGMETKTLSGGRWIFGEIETYNAAITDAGSGDWTLKPRPPYGRNYISKVTIIPNSGRIKFAMITTSGTNTSTTSDIQGAFEVMLRGSNGGVIDNPDNFKFIAYVED